jgi:hypothetical protein
MPMLLARCILLLAVCAGASAAADEAVRLPRAERLAQYWQLPAGRGNWIAQTPDEIPAPKVESEAVAFANFGDAVLKFQYWNAADSKWVVVELPFRGRVTLPCPKCGKEIKLSFHDGQRAQTTSLPMGAAYAWYWSGNQWNVGPYEFVQQIIRAYRPREG